MPRKYDRVIRYYASWFDDLLDQDKELTPSECWEVMFAIKECQVNGTLEPLHNLPVSIRRALSLATMGEQITRLLERSERMRERGSKGGRATAERTPEERAAAAIKEESLARSIADREQIYENNRKNALTHAQYLELKKKAQEGDEAAIKALSNIK